MSYYGSYYHNDGDNKSGHYVCPNLNRIVMLGSACVRPQGLVMLPLGPRFVSHGSDAGLAGRNTCSATVRGLGMGTRSNWQTRAPPCAVAV